MKNLSEFFLKVSSISPREFFRDCLYFVVVVVVCSLFLWAFLDHCGAVF